VKLDIIIVKIKGDKRNIDNAIYLLLEISLSGNKELFGMQLSENEGAKLWMSILTEIKSRDVKDLVIVCAVVLNSF